MAIENTATRRSFDTDGISRAFAVNWRVLDAADITVVQEDIASGDAAPLRLGSDYTVSLSTDGAMVTALTVPPAGRRWHIIRQTAPIQPVRLPAQGALPSARVETTLDRQAMVGQETQRDLARALTAPIHEAADLQLPTVRRRAERLLTFGADGLPQASTFTADQVAAAIDSAPLQMLAGAAHAFQADGVSTVYPLPAEWGLIYAAVTLLVNIGGIGGLTAGYTLTSGADHGYPGRTVIIFAAPLPAYVPVEVRIPPAAAQPMVDDTTQIVAAGSDTPRPLRERAADLVNVLDHGARPDGLTDSRPAIVKAAAVAALTGAAVQFPPGNYVTSAFEAPVSLYLEKGATLRAVDGASGHLITITAHGVRLYGAGIIDANKGGAPGGLSAVYARECHGVEIDGLTIQNAAKHGIGLYDASGLRVRNVRVSGHAWAQVQVYCDREDLSDVVIEAVEASGPVKAVAVSNISPSSARKSMRGIRIRRCTATGAGAAQVAMEIWCGGQVSAFDCSIEQCRVNGGVFAYSLDGVQGGSMVDCHAAGPAQIGYELATSPSSRVVNSTLDIMGAIGAGGTAAPLTAVSVSGASTDAEVSDVAVVDSVGGGKIVRAVYVGDTSHRVTISRTRVLATVDQGIVCNGVQAPRLLHGNYIANAVYDAVAAYVAPGLRVLAGLKVGTAFNGILLTGAGTDDIRIEGNDLRGCTANAYNPVGTFGTNVWIRGNEDGQLDWQQPLYFAPTGIAPRRQMQVDAIANTNRNWLIGGANGGNCYLDTTAGNALFKAGGTSALLLGTDGTATFYGPLRVGNTTSLGISGGLVPQIQIASSGTNRGIGVFQYSANATSAMLAFVKSRGASIGAVGAVQSGDTITNLRFCGDDGTSIVDSANIIAMVDGGVSTGSVPGRIVFLTAPTGSSTTLERMRIDRNGNVVIGTAALATTATDGFLYITTCAGTPTGVPTAYTGKVPLQYDATNNRIYVYNGAWKQVALT